MKVIKITQHILDVIKNNNMLFEMTSPEIGDIWKVTDIKTYPKRERRRTRC